MYVCICVYLYIYIYICVCMCTCIRVYIYIYMNPAFLRGHRWRSMGNVPKWAGGRYAIPPHSSPSLRSSSLHRPQAGCPLI